MIDKPSAGYDYAIIKLIEESVSSKKFKELLENHGIKILGVQLIGDNAISINSEYLNGFTSNKSHNLLNIYVVRGIEGDKPVPQTPDKATVEKYFDAFSNIVHSAGGSKTIIYVGELSVNFPKRIRDFFLNIGKPLNNLPNTDITICDSLESFEAAICKASIPGPTVRTTDNI